LPILTLNKVHHGWINDISFVGNTHLISASNDSTVKITKFELPVEEVTEGEEEEVTEGEVTEVYN